MSRPPMAFGYCRVSTKAQAEGLSLETQRAMIEEYFRRVLKPKGVEWVRHYEDEAVSASRYSMEQREAGSKLLYAAGFGDHVIMAKLDRAFRRAGDAAMTMERWGQQGISFHMLDLNLDSSSAIGRMILGVMAYFAQFERDQIAERTRAVLRHRKKLGLPIGRNPYGLKSVGMKGHRRRIPDEKLREIGKHIVKWKLSGFSWEEIYFHLLAQRVQNPAGLTLNKEWTLSAIRRAFAGECGLLGKEEAEKIGKKSSP